MKRRMLPLYAAAAFLFLYLPLITLSLFSFNSSRFTVWQGFSMHLYSAAFHDSELMEAAANSLHHRVGGHRALHHHRHTLRLRPVETQQPRAAGFLTFRWSHRRSSRASLCSHSSSGFSGS